MALYPWLVGETPKHGIRPTKRVAGLPTTRVAGLPPGPTSTVESAACLAGGVLFGRIRGLYSLGNGQYTLPWWW